MSKKYKIEYLPIAENDLTEIYEYILNDNPSAAINLIDRIDESISKLADFPFMGVTPNDPRLRLLGYRMLIIDAYHVFYVVLHDEIVEIRRILHGKRLYNFLL